MKILLLLFSLLLLPNPVDDISKSLVRIESQDEEGSHYCTGFVILKGEALTARHCAPDGRKVYVDGEESKILKRDDLFALLSLKKEGKPPLFLRGWGARVGEEVWSFGFAGDLTIVDTRVNAVVNEDVWINGPLYGGMSGGPLVDGKGRVVGINQMTSRMSGVACGVKEIKDFLRK